jgi:hypothetical protein
MPEARLIPKRELVERFVFHGQILEGGGEGKPFLVQGRFQLADELNGNGRIYPRSLWQKITADKTFTEKIHGRQMLGELDHPEDGKTSLKRVSHLISDVAYNEATGEVTGKAEIFDNPDGKRLQELFRRGVAVGISSRGSGSVKEEYRDGKRLEIVQDDYELMTWDFVSDPSTPGAFPTPISEQKDKPNTEELDMDSVTRLKEIKSRIDFLSESIRPGADFGAIGNQLIEAEVESSRIAGQDPAAADAAKSVKSDISAVRTRLNLAKRNDPTTQEGLRRRLNMTLAMLSELRKRYKGLAEKLANGGGSKSDAQRMARAIRRTLATFPLERLLIKSGYLKNEGKLAQENKLLRANLTKAIRESKHWRSRYLAAGKLAEALALVGRHQVKKMYAENLVRGRADAAQILPMLMEGKSIPDIAQRFKVLRGQLTESRRDGDLPDPTKNGTQAAPQVQVRKPAGTRDEMLVEALERRLA